MSLLNVQGRTSHSLSVRSQGMQSQTFVSYITLIMTSFLWYKRKSASNQPKLTLKLSLLLKQLQHFSTLVSTTINGHKMVHGMQYSITFQQSPLLAQSHIFTKFQSLQILWTMQCMVNSPCSQHWSQFMYHLLLIWNLALQTTTLRV